MSERLRLEPIEPRHTDDLHLVLTDPAVAEWYGTWTREAAAAEAERIAEGWREHGVHKWMAYERDTGECVGRGGLSWATVDGARRLEVGWALRGRFHGRGYATEIGRAGLEMAFGELGAREVVSFTETRNVRSRAVMVRLGLAYRKDILVGGEPFVLYSTSVPLGSTSHR